MIAKKPPAKPTWTQRYRLGVEINKQVMHFATLEEVAEELGITKQNAYTETCLALGTLIYRLREKLGLPPNIELHYSPDADVFPHNVRLGESMLA